MANIESNKYQNLTNILTYKVYYRNILNNNFSWEILNFLLKSLKLSLSDLEKKWNTFSNQISNKYWEIIPILTFWAVIEAWDLIIKKILLEKNKNNTLM